MSRDLLALIFVVLAGLATLASSRSPSEFLGGLIAFMVVAALCFTVYRYASR